MVAITDLNTGLGRRFCMTALVKTFSPKISPGASGVGKIADGSGSAVPRRLIPAVLCLPSYVLLGYPLAESSKPDTTECIPRLGFHNVKRCHCRHTRSDLDAICFDGRRHRS